MNPRLAGRLAATMALTILFYSLDWVWLRVFTRAIVATLLGILGHHALLNDTGSGITLLVDHRPFEFTANCTYVDLMLIITAFLWRFDLTALRNAIRTVTWSLIIIIFNMLRITFAMHLNLSGMSWGKMHDIPDMVIHCAVISVAVLFAIRSDSPSGDRV